MRTSFEGVVFIKKTGKPFINSEYVKNARSLLYLKKRVKKRHVYYKNIVFLQVLVQHVQMNFVMLVSSIITRSEIICSLFSCNEQEYISDRAQLLIFIRVAYYTTIHDKIRSLCIFNGSTTDKVHFKRST